MMAAEDRGQTFRQRLVKQDALQKLVRAAGIAILFGVATLSLEWGSYSTYNVLGVVQEGLPCRLVSVAHHDYLYSGIWVVWGMGASMFAYLIGRCEYETSTRTRMITWVMPAYLLVLVAMVLYLIAVVFMAAFIRHGCQPALMHISQPFDGYICPPMRGNAG